MINVLFFARIREQLGVAQLTIERADSVAQLLEHLVAQNGDVWAEVLCAPNVIVAVNQEVADHTSALHSGDEVAFFPPVTGG